MLCILPKKLIKNKYKMSCKKNKKKEKNSLIHFTGVTITRYCWIGYVRFIIDS